MEQLLIPCECKKCGAVDESKLSIAGPHVKQSCQKCGAYQKFIPAASIPDIQEIKIKIWGVCNGNLQIINDCKKEMHFVDLNLTKTQLKIQYWKLYLLVAKKIQKK